MTRKSFDTYKKNKENTDIFNEIDKHQMISARSIIYTHTNDSSQTTSDTIILRVSLSLAK